MMVKNLRDGMKVYRERIPQKELCLTIGTFDGVHLGHQEIINTLISYAKKHYLLSTVVTFSNHPSEIIGNEQIKLITSPEHKLKIFKEMGVDKTLIIPFTKELSKESEEEFLSRLGGIEALFLGYDAKIGHKGSGDKNKLLNMALERSFHIEYMPPVKSGDIPISSSRIREHIQENRLEEASKLLGRPYSIYGKVESGAGKGKKMGYPTMNIPLKNLVHPQKGVWAVIANGQPAIANLGFAPTFNRPGDPVLEVHFFNEYDPADALNVEFKKFLREEKKFDSTDELKGQIANDVAAARNILNAVPAN